MAYCIPVSLRDLPVKDSKHFKYTIDGGLLPHYRVHFNGVNVGTLGWSRDSVATNACFSYTNRGNLLFEFNREVAGLAKRIAIGFRGKSPYESEEQLIEDFPRFIEFVESQIISALVRERFIRACA